MLPLAPGGPKAASLAELARLQGLVGQAGDFAAQVARGKSQWDGRRGTAAGKAAFDDVRETLARLCTGPRRCHYCEDSAADEIEHVQPKDLFPDRVFVWENYLFACGPCNGPKGNRYGYVDAGKVTEIRRHRSEPLKPPPALPAALIDPRREDPRDFLELDLGGVTPAGETLEGTFEYLPRFGIDAGPQERARFTIDILGLNRQVLIDARKNAFSGYRARIREYLDHRANGAAAGDLATMKSAILATPHLTVFSEMRAQARLLPFMGKALAEAPEIGTWPLVPARP